MLNDILEFNRLGGRYLALSDDLANRKPTGITSLTLSEKVHIAAYNPYFCLYITPDRVSARNITLRVNEFLGEGKAVCLPEREDLLLHRHITGNGGIYERCSALTAILSGQLKVLVMPIEAVMQYYPNKELYESLIINLSVNDSVDIEALSKRLVLGNYKREERISDKGSFSIRGDLIEIYPVNMPNPVRISLFDDTIEYIRIFEPESMLSTGEVKSVVVSPASDIIVSESACTKAIQGIKRQMQNEAARLRTDEIIEDIKNINALHQSSPSLVWLIPYLKEYMCSILKYLPKDALIIYDEPRNIDEKASLMLKEHNNRLDRLIISGEALSAHRESILPASMLYSSVKGLGLLSFQVLRGVNPIFNMRSLYHYNGRAVSSYYLNPDSLVRDLRNFISRGFRVVICAGDKARAEGLISNLKSENIGVKYYEDLPYDFQDIAVIIKRISNGLILPESNLIIIGTNDVFRPAEKRIRLKRKRWVFTMPEQGDYVVHEIHGIGRCEGIVSLADKNSKKDYVLVTYKDNSKLYVPIDQLDLLERYSGGESNPSLSRIGGKEFERVKANVKKSIKKLAIDLIDIYSKREQQRGVIYPEDSVLEKEFEESFEYEDTIDQVEAVKEIKEDMQSGKIMDRLISGDVGYGKTEVALRAVFKTILAGKQAAILAPTTILAEQHYITARDRMEQFGIKCAVLSRFLTDKDIKNTLKLLKQGTIDVIVATHRLLSKDVIFKDLGLLVLDEEQRFGVEHKEKIKALKTAVNVLTLTATPIPRTLNMALTGLRDISILETPPVGRLPVNTYVTELTDSLIIDACERELNRDGQVIILYNKVADINQFAKRISELVPRGVIEIAHGQMVDGELEKAIANIYDLKANILICSTIIENGIDLPYANTLIVCDADRLGLTELYQLRGRVGRRDRLASAYFTVREGKVLTGDAIKRLQAITEYTEFGSGFKIAMRDLEIRGAGNILGREQHGHIGKVGYEVYCKLLEESIKELKGEEVIKTKDTEVSVAIDAYLSDKAAGGAENKMRIYKRIAEIRSLEDRETALSELYDILKKVDKPLINLIDISLIRALASNIGISKVIINDNAASLVFGIKDNIKSEKIMLSLSKNSKYLMLSNTAPPSIIFTVKDISVREKMNKIIVFLLNANGIY